MLGFELDFWDYATFLTAGLAGFAGVMTYIWIGLPGRIALARKHPEAEAVKIMGWAGLLPTILPWIQAQQANRVRLVQVLGGSFDAAPATTSTQSVETARP